MGHQRINFKQAMGSSIIRVILIAILGLLIFNMVWGIGVSRREQESLQVLLTKTITSSIQEPFLQGAYIEVARRLRGWSENKEIDCIFVEASGFQFNECPFPKQSLVNPIVVTDLAFAETTQSKASLYIKFNNSRYLMWLGAKVFVDLAIFLSILGYLLKSVSHFSAGVQHQLNRVLGRLRRSDSAAHENESSLVELYQLEQGILELLDKEKKYIAAEAEARLARQVSHDIRSPLSALQIALRASGENQANLIKQCIVRIGSIADDLLKNRGLDRQSFDPCLLSDILEEVIEEKQLEFMERSEISFVRSFSKSQRKIEINKSQLQRVLSNLINNSVESFKAPGVIEVFAKEVGDHVYIEVRDNGSGIPENVLNRLGEKGFSIGKDAHSQSGYGMGIPHAMEVVKSFPKGSLSIDSKPGLGTTIKISFDV